MSVCSNSRRFFSSNLSPERFFILLKTGIGSVTGPADSQDFMGIGSFGSSLSSQKAGNVKIAEIITRVKVKFFKDNEYILIVSSNSKTHKKQHKKRRTVQEIRPKGRAFYKGQRAGATSFVLRGDDRNRCKFIEENDDKSGT